MSKLTADDVVHAWKDEQYRSSLSEEVQSALPPAPENAGAMSDEELKQTAGGILFVPPGDFPGLLEDDSPGWLGDNDMFRAM